MRRDVPVSISSEIRRLFRGRPAEGPGAVGIELELLLRETARAPELAGAVDALEVAGRFSFEPGGQVEYSSTPRATLAGLVGEVREALSGLESAAAGVGVELVARGLSPVGNPRETGLVHPTPRYVEMDRHFAALGPWGAWMMRLTASLQVNLDLGPAPIGSRRWRITNALVPTLVATFANSPARLADGSWIPAGRSWVWRQLDPLRTGIVTADEPGDAPWSEYLDFALEAPVMFDARMRPLARDPRSAPSFRAWVDGSAGLGRKPDLEDWRVHLTTLFPEVRPRGRLEVRCIDVPSPRWWTVAPTLLSAVLYDERALTEVEALVEARRSDLRDLDGRAVRSGLRDDELGSEANALFRIAAAAIPRFPPGWYGADAPRILAAFRERYVVEGRTQADDIPPGEASRTGGEEAAEPTARPARVRSP